MSGEPPHNVTSVAAIDAGADPAEVAALARRLLGAVEGGELVVDG